jgi:poly-gamma-glutamate synthase PgsB/CapB
LFLLDLTGDVMLLIVALIVASLSYGVFEYARHLRYLRRIPVRVHVNGTRGKSSVTRLIGAGLRAGGVNTITKTTGTAPRFIFPDGGEVPVFRVGKANIIEQLKIIRRAVRLGTEALVMECMAVNPILQVITEHRIIRSTVGAITNARPDHLDMMGPTTDDVAVALCGTMRRGVPMFTSERARLEIFENEATRTGCELISVDPNGIGDDEMKRFSYIEHRDNIALALAVCEHLGVDRETALAGMTTAVADPGALRIYRIDFFDKHVEFVNAFAANDNDSYIAIWEILGIGPDIGKPVITMVNARADRLQRTEALAELIASGRLHSDRFVLTGQFTAALEAQAVGRGLARERIIDLGNAPPDEVFETIVSLTPESSLVVGIGNMVGHGQAIVDHFVNRGHEVVR